MTKLSENLDLELQKLGLSANEAKVYLAALGLGPSSANSISKQAGIKRSTTYLALNNLRKLGLVAEGHVNKKRLFTAEKPDKLEKLTKRMRRKVIAAELLLTNLVSSLKTITPALSQEPKVSVYQGMNGIKNILLDISGSTHSWYVFGSSTRLLQNLPFVDLKEILEEGEKMRQKAGRPKIYFMTDGGILQLKEFQEHRPERREIKIIPTIKESSVFIIFENKVAIFNFGHNPYAVVVESKEMVEVIRLMYKLLWDKFK